MSAPKVGLQAFPVEILSSDDAEFFASCEWVRTPCALCAGEALFEVETFGRIVAAASEGRGLRPDEVSWIWFCSKHSPTECAAAL